jgi:23S rRNA (adenine-N6)-dimethyltransferase
VAVRQRPTRVARGQHFLRSSRLAADLVRDAGVAQDDLVIDIGAGTGALTRALLDVGARVLALELDRRLADELRHRFDGRRVTVVETDARRWAWPNEPFSVVANLPFAGSLELLGHLLRDPRIPVERVDVIVQWELASKQAALWPATMRSTFWRAWFDVSIAGRLSRTAFAPAPSVDAGVLRFTRRARPLVPPAEHGSYRQLLDEAFRARQPLVRALRRRISQRELKRLAPVLGFDPSSSARDLDARQWAALHAFVEAASARSAGGRPRSRSRAREST